MKKYNINIKVLCLSLLLLVMSISCLMGKSKEDDDLFFVISLYENQQYDLAEQQINLFEKQYQNSTYANVMLYLRANIAFARNQYDVSDSLYTILLQKQIETSMQSEALTNQATIKYYYKDYPAALQLLSRASLLSDSPDEMYRIMLSSGKSHVKLMDYEVALSDFHVALDDSPFDKEAGLELEKLLIVMDKMPEGNQFIKDLIKGTRFSAEYTEHLNIWLDYLLENAAYSEVDSLEALLIAKNKPVSQTTTLRFIRKNYLQKDYQTALTKLQSITKYKPVCQFITGQIYAQQGSFAKADSIFMTLINMDNNTIKEIAAYNANLPLMAWLEHIKILFMTSPSTALNSLAVFLPDNQNSPLYVDALYLYGNLLYQDKQYNPAANTFIKLKELPISQLMQQNAQITLGDIWFYAKIYDQARFTYNRYLNLFPEGKYRAYAVYCIVMIDFQTTNYSEAKAGINQLLTMSGIEQYREKALFMLAEMDFFQANYAQALQQYQALNQQYSHNNETLYRIAQTLFYRDDYTAAAEFINAIATDSTNAFQISLLSGNIYFNLKQYDKAIASYDRALSFTHDPAESNEVKSYKALSFYRMGNFTAASGLYLQLSSEKESPEAYLLMAAKAAYHAKDYQHALTLFQQFTDTYPTSSFYQNAKANIGNIWYNEGSFDKAVAIYIDVLQGYKQNRSFNEEEQLILTGVFANLQWCLKQSPNQASLDSLNAMIDSFRSEYIKFELQYLLLRIYYGSGEWDDVLTMADELRSQFPQRENTEIKRLVAGSLVKINRYTDADSLYQSIYKIEPTATVLTEWAQMDIQQGNSTAALDKYDRALALDTSPERFISLLTFLDDNLPDSLVVHWQKWLQKFNPVPEMATLIWLRWNFHQGHWTDCLAIVPTLVNSSNQNTLAEVQTIYAISLYQTADYHKALIELLKTIYLYADFPDFVLEVKKTLIRDYLALNMPDDAKGIYLQIESELSAQEKTEFESILNIGKTTDEKTDSH